MVEMAEADHVSADPARYDLNVYWSIYVRNRDKGSLLRVHLPLIEAIIGNPAIPFQVFKEDDNPGLFRIIAYQNYPNSPIKEAIPAILGTAYSLANNWNIGGLGCLATGAYSYVWGTWTMRKPSPTPPALESMMFEIERGLAREIDKDGGISFDSPDDGDGLEHEAKKFTSIATAAHQRRDLKLAKSCCDLRQHAPHNMRAALFDEAADGLVV
jgi:hypothetical protein